MLLGPVCPPSGRPLRSAQVLRSGTERAYSALAFDLKGETLASVGSFPDFLLTLWDWRAESIVLRAKAFSQDVYTVAFSPYFEGQLTTSGASPDSPRRTAGGRKRGADLLAAQMGLRGGAPHGSCLAGPSGAAFP